MEEIGKEFKSNFTFHFYHLFALFLVLASLYYLGSAAQCHNNWVCTYCKLHTNACLQASIFLVISVSHTHAYNWKLSVNTNCFKNLFWPKTPCNWQYQFKMILSSQTCRRQKMCRKSFLGASRAISSRGCWCISNVTAPSSGKMRVAGYCQEKVSADTNPKPPNIKKKIFQTLFFFFFGLNTVPGSPFSQYNNIWTKGLYKVWEN